VVDQTNIFCESEANNWFSRNRKHLETVETGGASIPIEIGELCRWLDPFKSEIGALLEIGCSSGQKTELLSRAFNASGYGLDPSDHAVRQGNERLAGSGTQLICGTSDNLPFDDGYFDVVYFGFCLYLVDRTRLLKSISEADRVLKPGGYLAITDFDPGDRQKVSYIHKSGVYSFKQDYSACFLETGLYYLVAKSAFSHRQQYFDTSHQERVSVSLLYKEKTPYPTQKD